MTDDKQLREDLSYVRSVLSRAEGASGPASVYFLWAAITFFGFAIIDYAPEKSGFYWMIAGPAGGILSGVLGWRAGRAIGQSSSHEGWVHWMHWTGFMAVVLLLIPLAAGRVIPTTELPRLILLLVALAYWTAGVHLDRGLLWVGLAVAGCYVFTLVQRGMPYLWTITAAVLAASFVVCGLVTAARERKPGADPSP